MHLRYIITLSLLLSGSAAATASSHDIFGTWMRSDGAARVKMATCGEQICATNIWIKDPAGQNEKVGDRLIFKIKQSGDRWSGTGYDPQRKLNLSAKLHASADSMTTTGCVLAGLICRSTQWTRN
jgi:uncharacterized protein (DUF2147 family)